MNIEGRSSKRQKVQDITLQVGQEPAAPAGGITLFVSDDNVLQSIDHEGTVETIGTGGGGGGGEEFDQSLNTTDNVEFNNIIAQDIAVNDVTANNLEVKNSGSVLFSGSDTVLSGDKLHCDVAECEKLQCDTVEGKHTFVDAEVINDNMSSTFDGSLSGDATWINGLDIHLTPGSTDKFGAVSYFTGGTLGKDFNIEFDIYVGNSWGEDGNGFGWFIGNNTPTENNYNNDGIMQTTFTWSPGGSYVQYRTYQNGTTLDTSEPVGSILQNHWYKVKYSVTDGKLIQPYISGIPMSYSFTLSQPLSGAETTLGVYGVTLGMQSIYRVKNFRVTKPGPHGNWEGSVKMTMPTEDDLNLKIGNEHVDMLRLTTAGVLTVAQVQETGNNVLTRIGGKYSQSGLDVNVTNTTEKTSLIKSEIGTVGTLTFQPHEITAGSCYRLSLFGDIQTGRRNQELNIEVTLGETLVFSTQEYIVLEDTGEIRPFRFECDMACYRIQESIATIFSYGQFTYTSKNFSRYEYHGNVFHYENIVAIDLAERHVLDVTAKWGDDREDNKFNVKTIVLTKIM